MQTTLHPPANTTLPMAGDPPDLDAAYRWFSDVTAAIESTEAGLAALKSPQRPVNLRELTRQRSALIDQRADLAARQRELRDWIARRAGRAPMRSLAARSAARDREIRVDAMHAATRRFVLLEELFQRVEALVHDFEAADLLEHEGTRHIQDLWRPIVDQVQVIQNHGAG